jgi:hypothetical protein
MITEKAIEKLESIAAQYIVTATRKKSECFDPKKYKKEWLGATIQKMVGVTELYEMVATDENVYHRFNSLVSKIKEH